MVSWFIGGLLFGFQALEALISSGGDTAWKNLTLTDVIGQNYLDWVNGMSKGTIYDIVQYVITMPLFLLLFCVGILFFILSRLTSKL